LNPQQARQAITDLKAAEIVPVISLIVPVPGQSSEGLKVNKQAAMDLCKDGHACVVTQFPGLIPRTLWWEEREQFGFELLVDQERYNHFLATLKIRHIVPPPLWQPAPYLLDGRGFKEFAGMNAGFQNELSDAGVVINVPDEMVALAKVLDMELSSFRNLMQRLFFVMDAGELEKFVEKTNKRLTQ